MYTYIYIFMYICIELWVHGESGPPRRRNPPVSGQGAPRARTCSACAGNAPVVRNWCLGIEVWGLASLGYKNDC